VPYWSDFYRNRLTTAQLQAYYHYLLTLDISDWNPKLLLETDAVKDARQSQAPPHARFFQRTIQCDPDTEERQWLGRELLQHINQSAKFPLSEQKFGRDIQKYPHTKEHTRRGNLYTFNMAEVEAYLKARSWWVDGI
jgi:hypothetical protein